LGGSRSLYCWSREVLSVVKALLLPPLNLFLLGFLGLWLRQRRARLGNVLLALSLSLLYVLSTPLFGSWALSSLQSPYVDPLERAQAQAIVALAGGTYGPAPEYGADSVSQLTLVRVRYAAKLQRMTGKPLLVSGGSVSGETTPEAEQMRGILTDEMNVPVRWVEDRSRDTFTNALESYRILAPQGITTIYLVSHAWHMPRARLAFEHAGFQVIAAPTGFSSFGFDHLGIHDFLPRASAFLNSYYFCHEVLGYLAYLIRARI